MTVIRCFALAILFSFSALPAWSDIARMDLNGAIDPVTAEFVVRGITRAEMST